MLPHRIDQHQRSDQQGPDGHGLSRNRLCDPRNHLKRCRFVGLLSEPGTRIRPDPNTRRQQRSSYRGQERGRERFPKRRRRGRDRGGGRDGAAGGAHPLLRDLREGVQARREFEDAHAGPREPVQDARGLGQTRQEPGRAEPEDPVLVPLYRVQPKQGAREVPGAEIGDLREESLQAKPLPEDVLVQSLQQEELFGRGGFEEPPEALRRGAVALHVRHELLEEEQAVWAHGLV